MSVSETVEGTPASPLAFALATRIAGSVIALGYLVGAVPGPLIGVVGGLALITFGRGLVTGRTDEALAGGALAILAGALGVAALRWGTLDLGDLRAAQAVLGPTVRVGSDEAAAAAICALTGGVLALGVWLGTLRPAGATDVAVAGLEAVVGGLALVTAFWGPEVTSLERTGEWALATAAVVAVGVGLAWGVTRASPSAVPAWIALMLAAGGVGAGAVLVAGAL